MVHEIFERWFSAGHVTFAFQPIVTLTAPHAVHAIEALTRGPRGTQFEDPSVFFEYLRQTGQEARADRRCIAGAIRAAAACTPDEMPRISINVHPSTLERDAELPSFLASLLEEERFDAARVVLEIIEESRPGNTRRLVAAVGELRKIGVAIALDDVGVGRCNLKTVVDVAPDVLKIDRYFVDHSADDVTRRVILESVQRLAETIGAAVVAEGVEREQDAVLARALGIDYAQGFLFARPRPLHEAIHRTHAIPMEADVCQHARRSCSSTTRTPF
jgi:EAL domain-containing protein (putative c-di-GMP-specific phosphodiesterase class I)